MIAMVARIPTMSTPAAPAEATMGMRGKESASVGGGGVVGPAGWGREFGEDHRTRRLLKTALTSKILVIIEGRA